MSVLKLGAPSHAGGGSRWRAAVLAAEIALAAVLLVATTLFVSSFVRVTRADLGFQRANLLLVDPPAGLQGPVTDFRRSLESIPGVEAVGGAAAGSPPLVMAGFGGGASGTRLRLPGAPPAEFVAAEFNRVSAGYLDAAAIPVLRGRVFDTADTAASDIVILDERAARRLFGDLDPVGRKLVFGAGQQATVVGVIAHVRVRGPEVEAGAQAYFPGPSGAGAYAYLVRTSRPPATLAPLIQRTIAGHQAPGSKPALIRPIEDAFRNITARRRFSAGTMAIFGALALLIGVTGVYGVTSAFVAQRTREIGVRVALGASARQIAASVLKPMGRALALGLAIGLPAAWLLTRTFAASFFEVRPTDLWVYVAVGALLSAAAVSASLAPARRASAVDPLLALRSE